MTEKKFVPKRIPTELSSPVDAIASIFAAFAALFGKQRNNEMLRDLRIKKGFFPGLRYSLFLAIVLPFRLLAFVLTPSWTWVRFVERQIISPLLEFATISGDSSPSVLLGNVYERYLHTLSANEKNGIEKPVVKPEISSIDRVLIYAKLRVLLALCVFAMVAILLGDGISGLGDAISFLLGFLTTLFSPWTDTGHLIISVLSGATVYWVLVAVMGAFVSYLFIFAIRFVLEMFTQLIYTDRKIMQEFIDDTLHYTILKSMEIYGEDMAMAAYEFLMENYTMQGSRYQKADPHYTRLPWDKPKIPNEDPADQ